LDTIRLIKFPAPPPGLHHLAQEPHRPTPPPSLGPCRRLPNCFHRCHHHHRVQKLCRPLSHHLHQVHTTRSSQPHLGTEPFAWPSPSSGPHRLAIIGMPGNRDICMTVTATESMPPPARPPLCVHANNAIMIFYASINLSFVSMPMMLMMIFMFLLI
jgi:hypothetical protein